MAQKISRFVFYCFFYGLNFLPAIETKDGYIRLNIDDKSYNFSLYYLADTFADEADAEYEPLFSNKDPRTSFLEVNVNGKIYRLGKSSVFRTRIEKQGTNPAVVFESPFLLINEVFSPVRTSNSRVANGVKITLNVKNTGDSPTSVGFRMLIDTYLGEKRGDIPFETNNLKITNEKIIKSTSGETYWISRGERLSLMGSIVNPTDVAGRNPDFLHFANWKKLTDFPWKAPYYEGRFFNYTNYSVGDSAVCYYWEPSDISAGDSAVYTFFLTTADPDGFVGSKSQTEQEQIAGSLKESIVEYNADYPDNEDILILQRLQGTLDRFLAGEINLSEQDLLEIEDSIVRIKAKYNNTLQ